MKDKLPQREKFAFMESWAQTMQYLPDNMQLSLYRAITELALYGKEPHFDTDESMLLAVWPSIREGIVFGRTKWANGCNGGAPMGNKNAQKSTDDTDTQAELKFDATPTDKNNQDSTKKQPKNNQETTKKQPLNETIRNETHTTGAPVREGGGAEFLKLTVGVIADYCKAQGFGLVDAAEVLEWCMSKGNTNGWRTCCKTMHMRKMRESFNKPTTTATTPTAERKPISLDNV